MPTAAPEATPAPLKLFMVAPEVTPFAKVGGLADVFGRCQRDLLRPSQLSLGLRTSGREIGFERVAFVIGRSGHGGSVVTTRVKSSLRGIHNVLL